MLETPLPDDLRSAVLTAYDRLCARLGREPELAVRSRELGLPCIVGAGDATGVLRDRDEVTVSCAEGSKGAVYAGRIPFEVERVDAAGVPQTRTRVMLNPDTAIKTAVVIAEEEETQARTRAA